MSASTVSRPVRQFRIGATNLADPDPGMEPEAVIALYAANYPALRFATLAEPVLEGDVLVFEAKLPDVQTKG